MILHKIVANKRLEVDELKIERPLETLVPRIPTIEPHQFGEALRSGDGVKIIAEVKKGSPSKGIMVEDFDPAGIASDYGAGGAAALSVLTDRKFFYGSFENLGLAKESSGLPALCKDFVIDRYQLYYARLHGADAVLIIAALHSTAEIKQLIDEADTLGLDCLVEVHDQEELKKALDAGARIVGVNNRDLRDFTVTLDTSLSLAPGIPKEVIAVSESGISTPEDIAVLREAGFTAFLIGESLVTAGDRIELLKRLRTT